MYLVLIGVALYIFWKLFMKSKSESEPPEIPGRLPLIGHGHKFLGDSTELLKALDKIAAECAANGGVSYIYMGPWKIYVLTDPEDSLTVSNTCLDKDYVYSFIKPLLGDGLVTSDEQTWKKHRKLINPAFSQAVLNSFISTFDSQAKLLLARFATKVGKPFDHEEELRLNFLETVCLTAMGTDGQSFSDLQKQYVPLMAQWLNIVTERFQKVWLHSDLVFNLSPLKKAQDKLETHFKQLCLTFLDRMMETIIYAKLIAVEEKILQKKRAEIKTNEIQQNKSNNVKPFLELMLNLAEETDCFTDEEIRDETNSIVLAGHDTSASTLTFAFAVLGSYPDIQAKVYNEVMEVFNNKDECDKDMLSKLVYTEAVIKETLRLYPIAPLVARRIDSPVKLKNCTLSGKSRCFMFLGALNRDPSWGEDVDEFRPERWLDPTSLPSAECFGTFSLGKRACIGRAYAIMSMKVSVAHVVRRFRISADVTKMVLKWDMMIRPRSGHHIKLEERNNAVII